MKPKFEIGNRVSHPETLYDETKGKIVEVERVYSELDEDGNFEHRGLCTIESTIKSFCVPYTFDGETLVVTMPKSKFTSGYTRTSKFHHYAYTVKTPKMRTIFSEKSLRRI